MNTTATEPLTYEDFVRLHGDEKLVDLVNGRVVRYPMPHAEHGYISNNVVGIIGPFVGTKDWAADSVATPSFARRSTRLLVAVPISAS